MAAASWGGDPGVVLMTLTIVFLAALLLLSSVASIFQWPHGFFRALEFPRVQVLIASLLTVVTVPVSAMDSATALWVMAALTVACAIQISYIIRFTPIWPKAAAMAQTTGKQRRVRILISNVKKSNRKYELLIQTIKNERPDIVVMTEVDKDWRDALQPAAECYPHRMECPMENSFGLMLFSSHPLSSSSIRYLVSDEVPSFDTLVHPDAETVFRLVAVHPEPPIVTSDSTLRDAELSKVALLLSEEEQPVIVTGDLNDVAWSKLTRRFLRISGLVDPREGRGLYSTFHADHIVLRWPLDHLFHSRHFRIARITRLASIGSDHFPIVFELAVDPAKRKGQPSADPDSGDIEEAKKTIRAGEESDRRPIGHDWEK